MDPYTPEHPPPGWLRPPQLIPLLFSLAGNFPWTSFPYANLSPFRQSGLEF